MTITLPTAQVEALKQITENVSGYVAEAVARRLRGELIDQELDRYEREHGAFTEEELAQARAEIYGSSSAGDGAAAA
ncbi:hypothetical protein OG709_17620 [Streptomyces sp. NBC_01267]|uniref:hypothetical protein n=1 Tax=Streptomyces sp. NBC_01267 TaxID=2903805 RepID=UPI002E364870|nr:hypothetical protein [Streptomyces sp. NBC_01267]